MTFGHRGAKFVDIKGAEGKEGCQLTAMPAEALAKVGCRLTAEKLAKFESLVYSF